MERKERRLKSFNFTKRELIKLFFADTIITQHGDVVKFAKLPDDVKMIDIHWNFETQTLRFILESEDFPLTPEGGHIINAFIGITETQTKKQVVEWE